MSAPITLTIDFVSKVDRCRGCGKPLRPEQCADVVGREAQDVARPLIIVEAFCAACVARRPS